MVGADNRVVDTSGSIGFVCRESLDGESAKRGIEVRSRGGALRPWGIHAATLTIAAWAALTLFAWLGTSTADARVLVSNMSQTGTDRFWCLNENSVWAQRFTTGANALGYDLENIELEIDPPSSDWNDVSVHLHKASVFSGGRVVKLENPTGSGQAVRSFDVPANTDVTLDPNTHYYVRVDSEVNEDCPGALRVTDSNGEDSGGLSDWSIEDTVLSSGNDGVGFGLNTTGRAVKIRVNGSAPENTKVSAIWLSSSPGGGEENTYRRGDLIEVSVRFTREVEVSGNVHASLWMNGWRGAGYNRGSGTDTLVYRYVVVASDTDTDGVAIGAAGLGGDGSIVTKDTTVPVNLSNGRVNSDHKVDGRAYIRSVRISSDPAQGDTYRHDEAILVTVAFNGPVRLTGNTLVSLFMDDGWRGAGYHSGSGTNTLVFRYVVDVFGSGQQRRRDRDQCAGRRDHRHGGHDRRRGPH